MRNSFFPSKVLVTLTAIAFIEVAPAQVSGTLLHDGLTRSYELYVPSTWSVGQSLPLVFVLHGTTQDGAGIMDITDFNSIAEAEGFIAIYPDGIGGSWNTGIAGASTADDLGLMDALATEMTLQYGIDTTRVYSCGFSAGGYMSHRLACESPRCFAAIASVAGTMTVAASAACAPSHITPVMQVHGTADFVVAYNGGAIAGLGAEAVLAQWNGYNGCPASPVITALPNIDPLDLSTVEQQVWSPCATGSSNVLLKVIGGGHQWPGTTALLGGIGVINRDIDASAEIWDFFSDHACGTNSTAVSATPVRPTSVRYTSGEEALLVLEVPSSTTFQLLDLRGRVWLEGVLAQGDNRLSVRSLAAGIYLFRSGLPGTPAMRFVKTNN